MGVDYPASRKAAKLTCWPGRADNYFFLRVVAALVGAAAFAASPINVFKGQILTAGHLLQPATTATGQIVMMVPLNGSA
jgi:hypothetical protein